MSQIIQPCDCANKAVFKIVFQRTINDIRAVYHKKIQEMERKVAQLQLKTASMQKIIIQNDEVSTLLNQQIKSLKQKVVELEQNINEKQQSIKKLQDCKQQYIAENKIQLAKLQYQLTAKQNQIIQLKKLANYDAFSNSMSSVSKKDFNSKSYSFDLKEYCQNYPKQTQKLLQSVSGQIPAEPRQLGDMICMFIGKDDMSIEKYENVNRTFLKRKIKDEERRFRYVIIYKKDKK